MRTDGLNLVIPEKADPERSRVADSWRAHGGTVTQIGRFWDPPELDRAAIRIYANDTFALVLAQKLGLRLVSPDDDLLLRLPAEHIGRRIRIMNLRDACRLCYPTFVKPVVPKQFRAGVYETWPQLETECSGLNGEVRIYESEVVGFDAEVRSFILRGQVQDAAVYEGSAPRRRAMEFLSAVACSPALPATCVLDVGYVARRGWMVIEANAAWGAGLNGCNPDKALGSIAHATQVAA